MFNEQLFKSDAILTGTGIQDRWQKAVKTRAQKTPIFVSEYWLLSERETEPFIKCTLFENNSEKNDNNSEKNTNNSEKNTNKEEKNKEKEKKINNIHHLLPRARAQEIIIQKWERNPTEEELDILIAMAASFEEAEELLEEALGISARANAKTAAFVRGIFSNMHRNKIKTIEEYWEHEAERDIRKGRI